METAADDTALEVLINVAVLVHVRLRRKVRRQPLPFAGAVSAAKAVPSKAHVLTDGALWSALLPAEAVPPTPGPIALGAGQVPGGPHNTPNTPGAPPPCATLTSFRTCFRSQELAADPWPQMGGPSRTPSIAPRSVPTSSLAGRVAAPTAQTAVLERAGAGAGDIDRTGGLAHFHCNRPWM